MYWWEKTIEYAFVITAAKDGRIDFAAPLSGKHERLLGDSIMGTASSLVLIEFKRDETGVPSEMSLFHDFDAARDKLNKFGHHHFVYGKETAGEVTTIELVAETYFCRKRRNRALDCLDHGADLGTFREYLSLLAELKKADGRSTSGHVTPEALSTVLGLDKDGKIVAAQPLHEFAPQLFPMPIERIEFMPEAQSPEDMPSTGMGMP